MHYIICYLWEMISTTRIIYCYDLGGVIMSYIIIQAGNARQEIEPLRPIEYAVPDYLRGDGNCHFRCCPDKSAVLS